MIIHHIQSPAEIAARKASRDQKRAALRERVRVAVAEALDAAKVRRAKWRAWRAGRVA